MDNKKKKYFQLLLLILAAGSIYPLLYMRTNFEAPMLEVFNMKQSELANIYSNLGWLYVIGYIPSGWLADKFQSKKLIIFSLFGTALIGLYYAQIPDKSQLQFIFPLWGITTVFTFWSALIKAVNNLAEDNEKGLFMGALDGGRGVVEAVLGTIAVSLFAYFVGNTTKDLAATKAGLQAAIYMYSIAIIILAVLLTIFMPAQDHKVTKEEVKDVNSEDGFNLKTILKIMKIKEVWLMIIVLFCGYSLFWTIYYWNTYLTINQEATSVFAGFATVGILWMRPIGGIGAGLIADKVGKFKMLALVMLIASLCIIGLALLGVMNSTFIVGAILIVAILSYAIRGLYWSTLDDTRIPASVMGVGIGIISFFGYLPDIILPKISSYIYSTFGDNVAGANSAYLIISALIGIVGAITCVYFGRVVKMNKEVVK